MSLFGSLLLIAPMIALSEIPLPNEVARMDILKIHSLKLLKHGDIGTFTDIFELMNFMMRKTLAIVMYIHMAFMHRLGGDREDDGRLQRRGPAQRVHRGGDVRDPRRTRLHPRGGPAGRCAKALRQQEARDQIGLQAGLSLSLSPLVSLFSNEVDIALNRRVSKLSSDS